MPLAPPTIRSTRPRALLVASALLTSLLATAPSADESALEAGALRPDDRLVSGTLDNGLAYTVVENAQSSGALSVRLRIGSGSLDEPENRSGLAHFLEHMAFNGSSGVPEGELNALVAEHGAGFGRHSNAYTDFAETVYQLDFPGSDEATLETALFVMREFASELTLDEAAVTRERGIILAEHRTRTTPELHAFAAGLELLVPETDYPDHFSVGDLDSPRDIVAIGARSLRDYYERHYVPSNAQLVLVGDAPAATLVAAIERHFDDWAGKAPPARAPARIDPARPAAARVYVAPALPSTVSVNFITGDVPEDGARAREDDVALDVALRLVGRRLQRAANAEDAPLVSAEASREVVDRVVERVQLGADVADGDWAGAIDVLATTLERALVHGFAPEEVSRELDAMRADVEDAALGADARTSPEIADALVTDIHERVVSTSPAEDLAHFDRAAVEFDAEAVRDALAAGTSVSEPLLFLTAPSPVDGGERAVLERYARAADGPVEVPDESSGGELAYARLGDVGEIVSDEREDVLGVRRLRFDNGVAANLLRTEHTPGQVVVSLRVGRGAVDLAGTPTGLPTLLEDAFVQGGLGEHPIDELEDLLVGRRIELEFGMGEDHFGGTYETRPADLETQLRLLAAYLVDPGFRPRAERRFRSTVEEMGASTRSSAGNVAWFRMPSIVRGDDARFGLPPIADLRRVGFDDLRDALEAPFGTGVIELGIVGDLDETAAMEALASTFGALPDRVPPAAPDPAAVDARMPLGEHRTLTHEGDADDAAIVLGWPTGDAENGREGRLQSVLEAVFVARLGASVRERMGATYTPVSFSERSRVFPDFGYLGFYVEVLPDSLDAVRAAVLDIADGLGSERPVTDGELAAAIAPLLADVESERTNNAMLVGPVSMATSRPGELSRFYGAREEYEAVSAEVLNRFAARTFDGAPLIVEILPDAEAAPER